MGIIFQRVQSPPRNLPRVERKERETAEAKALQCPFPSLPTPVVESQGLLRVGCAHLWLQEEAGSDPYLKHRETQDSGYGEAETQGETILRSLEEGPGLLLPHLSPPCPHQESTGARGMWVDRMDHVMALTPQNCLPENSKLHLWLSLCFCLAALEQNALPGTGTHADIFDYKIPGRKLRK
nr:uncharacterized protein LOC123289379 isoform X1 [Equus asinus]